MKLLILLITFFLVACDYKSFHSEPGNEIEQGQGICVPQDSTAAVVTYEEVRAAVFAPRCISCHGGNFSAAGLDLTNYSGASSWANQIRAAVASNRMPLAPNPPLSDADKELVFAWVDGGALEVDPGQDPSCLPDNNGQSDPVDPNNPTDPADPVEPQPKQPVTDPVTGELLEVPADELLKFALIKDKVFGMRCLSCHSNAVGNFGGLNLETYENTIDEIDDILSRVTTNSMPPRSVTPLGDVEKETLLRWIVIGSPL